MARGNSTFLWPEVKPDYQKNIYAGPPLTLSAFLTILEH